jgi:GNAT superfamily N-acetyltransferase
VGKTPSILWEIQRLSPTHDKASLDCGKPQLNQWLQRFSGQYERKDLARTYVAVQPGQRVVLGYYALSTHCVCCEVLPEEQIQGLPDIDIPVVLLGRLAVDKNVQGHGLGADLLMDALARANYLSQHIGVRAMEVQAIDADARRFYLKYGFLSLRDDSSHLFLPIKVIRQLNLASCQP